MVYCGMSLELPFGGNSNEYHNIIMSGTIFFPKIMRGGAKVKLSVLGHPTDASRARAYALAVGVG